MEYNINLNATTVAIISKDPSGVIRKVDITENEQIVYTAKYFPDGQLEEKTYIPGDDLSVSELTHFYHKGGVEYIGQLKNKEKIGEWNYLDRNGILKKVETYNELGQLVKKAVPQP